jgi:hypothetical protein
VTKHQKRCLCVEKHCKSSETTHLISSTHNHTYIPLNTTHNSIDISPYAAITIRASTNSWKKINCGFRQTANYSSKNLTARTIRTVRKYARYKQNSALVVLMSNCSLYNKLYSSVFSCMFPFRKHDRSVSRIHCNWRHFLNEYNFLSGN